VVPQNKSHNIWCPTNKLKFKKVLKMNLSTRKWSCGHTHSPIRVKPLKSCLTTLIRFQNCGCFHPSILVKPLISRLKPIFTRKKAIPDRHESQKEPINRANYRFYRNFQEKVIILFDLTDEFYFTQYRTLR
jgi:hypothetical protein